MTRLVLVVAERMPTVDSLCKNSICLKRLKPVNECKSEGKLRKRSEVSSMMPAQGPGGFFDIDIRILRFLFTDMVIRYGLFYHVEPVEGTGWTMEAANRMSVILKGFGWFRVHDPTILPTPAFQAIFNSSLWIVEKNDAKSF